MRIIPANTGRMSRRGVAPRVFWDHPREYGENSSLHPTNLFLNGSSPRIRGELDRWGDVADGVGIIPANTGRIINAWFRMRRIRDHPREYGENAAIRSTPVAIDRIIPANTGRMRSTLAHRRSRRDHPREYGENNTVAKLVGLGEGSSPRIRGEYGGG